MYSGTVNKTRYLLEQYRRRNPDEDPEKMTREKMIIALSDVAELVAKKPWWQQNMLDEYSKATCDIPRRTQCK